MYGKHFQSMYTGSMFGAGANIFAVWGYVISHTRDGTCELNPSYLAAVLGMNISEVLMAINFLCQPDPSSRSKEQDGRRLIREGEYQYIVPQAEKYRKIRSRDDQRESNRERQRKFRESHRITREITTVTKNNDISEADPDPDPESEKDKDSLEPERPASKLEPVLIFKTVGKESEFRLYRDQLLTWHEAFPALEIYQQCVKAQAWLEANPTRRKTARGMPRFLYNWLGRSQNNGARP